MIDGMRWEYHMWLNWDIQALALIVIIVVVAMVVAMVVLMMVEFCGGWW